ncbi:uncharacterized protein LOC135264535 [Anguilla rostrata]|uniref:uncharacterized protein LOC135264535 n=1 Tax=Anguilla rostrata TaxID=7938 RepID=UPI0030CF1BF4
MLEGDGPGRRFISVADLEEEEFLQRLPSSPPPAERCRSSTPPGPVSLRCLAGAVLERSACPHPLSPPPLNEAPPPAPAEPVVTVSPPAGSQVPVTSALPAVLQAVKAVLEPQGAAVTLSDRWEPGQQGALSRNKVPTGLLEMNAWLASLQSIADRMEREIDETKKLITAIEMLDPAVDPAPNDVCEVINAGITQEEPRQLAAPTQLCPTRSTH